MTISLMMLQSSNVEFVFDFTYWLTFRSSLIISSWMNLKNPYGFIIKWLLKSKVMEQKNWLSRDVYLSKSSKYSGLDKVVKGISSFFYFLIPSLNFLFLNVLIDYLINVDFPEFSGPTTKVMCCPFTLPFCEVEL